MRGPEADERSARDREYLVQKFGPDVKIEDFRVPRPPSDAANGGAYEAKAADVVARRLIVEAVASKPPANKVVGAGQSVGIVVLKVASLFYRQQPVMPGGGEGGVDAEIAAEGCCHLEVRLSGKSGAVTIVHSKTRAGLGTVTTKLEGALGGVSAVRIDDVPAVAAAGDDPEHNDDDSAACPQCQKDVPHDGDGLACDRCGFWFHPACADFVVAAKCDTPFMVNPPGPEEGNPAPRELCLHPRVKSASGSMIHQPQSAPFICNNCAPAYFDIVLGLGSALRVVDRVEKRSGSGKGVKTAKFVPAAPATVMHPLGTVSRLRLRLHTSMLTQARHILAHLAKAFPLSWNAAMDTGNKPIEEWPAAAFLVAAGAEVVADDAAAEPAPAAAASVRGLDNLEAGAFAALCQRIDGTYSLFEQFYGAAEVATGPSSYGYDIYPPKPCASCFRTTKLGPFCGRPVNADTLLPHQPVSQFGFHCPGPLNELSDAEELRAIYSARDARAGAEAHAGGDDGDGADEEEHLIMGEEEGAGFREDGVDDDDDDGGDQ